MNIPIYEVFKNLIYDIKDLIPIYEINSSDLPNVNVSKLLQFLQKGLLIILISPNVN